MTPQYTFKLLKHIIHYITYTFVISAESILNISILLVIIKSYMQMFHIKFYMWSYDDDLDTVTGYLGTHFAGGIRIKRKYRALWKSKSVFRYFCVWKNNNLCATENCRFSSWKKKLNIEKFELSFFCPYYQNK